MSQHGADQPHSGPETAAGTGQSLMVIESGRALRTRPVTQGPDAAFIVQIMASKAHMGEFRRYRRTEPKAAIARYEAASALGLGLWLSA